MSSYQLVERLKYLIKKPMSLAGVPEAFEVIEANEER